jgi:hypothetical protein
MAQDGDQLSVLALYPRRSRRKNEPALDPRTEAEENRESILF